jgi:hypothetical protein
MPYLAPLTSFLVKAIDVGGAIDQKPPMSNSATRVIWEIGKHPRIPCADRPQREATQMIYSVNQGIRILTRGQQP